MISGLAVGDQNSTSPNNSPHLMAIFPIPLTRRLRRDPRRDPAETHAEVHNSLLANAVKHSVQNSCLICCPRAKLWSGYGSAAQFRKGNDMMRIIDLSVALDHVDVGPSAHRPKITYKNHDETWAGFQCSISRAFRPPSCRTTRPGQAKKFRSSRTAGRTWMRPGITIRQPITALRKVAFRHQPSTRSRWSGASSRA